MFRDDETDGESERSVYDNSKPGEIVLNDQGGQRMAVTKEVTATLRAMAHHPPVVMGATESFGFCASASRTAQTIGYKKETGASLRGQNCHDSAVLIVNEGEEKL